MLTMTKLALALPFLQALGDATLWAVAVVSPALQDRQRRGLHRQTPERKSNLNRFTY